jgi:hypothetical protein
VSLNFIKPRETQINKDIFKCAEFWLGKGYLIQNNSATNSNQIKVKENIKNVDVNNVALDYYLSGIKIDPRHFGCAYNVGCCYFNAKMFVNAKKWFDFAIKIRHRDQDSQFAKVVTCIKLG